MEPLLGYGDLTLFQNGGHPPSDIFKDKNLAPIFNS